MSLPDNWSTMSGTERDDYFADSARAYRKQKATLTPLAHVPAYTRGLVTLNGEELLKRPFPPQEKVLAPILPTQGLAMIFAQRGIGKTWVGLNIAHAVAGGGNFLRWSAPKPRRVVYIDGEMPGAMLQERYAQIVAGCEFDAPAENFRLVAADVQSDGLPDLADPTAQRFYDDAIQDAGLIIVDNLSTVCRSLRENEADSYGPVQDWALRQRAANRSVLFIHHAGKGGGQRGTSKKEDPLNTVIELSRPPDYDASQGARFEVRFSKNRGFFGADAEAFEAWLINGAWHTGEITRDDDVGTLRDLKAAGLSVRDIASRTGLSKSVVSRRLQGGDE